MSAGITTTDTMLPVELTLVVAATRDMGIGRAGGLPWTGLRKEMAYFARVTKRLPVDVSFFFSLWLLPPCNSITLPLHSEETNSLS